MALFELVAVTETGENEYVYHIRVPFGSQNYICQYTKDHLNSGSINYKITYRQTYIISIKYECFDGVFCYPIV